MLLRADKIHSSSDETKNSVEFEAIPEAIVGRDDFVGEEELRQSWRDSLPFRSIVYWYIFGDVIYTTMALYE